MYRAPFVAAGSIVLGYARPNASRPACTRAEAVCMTPNFAFGSVARLQRGQDTAARVMHRMVRLVAVLRGSSRSGRLCAHGGHPRAYPPFLGADFRKCGICRGPNSPGIEMSLKANKRFTYFRNTPQLSRRIADSAVLQLQKMR